jgi:hypothetical protein
MARTTNFAWTTDKPVSAVRDWAMTSLVPVLRKWGFRVETDSPETVFLRRKRGRPGLALYGYESFLARPAEVDSVVLTFTGLPSGLSQMRVVGDMPRQITDVLAGLPQKV